MITDEQLNEIFYNAGHWMNAVLRVTFGTLDQDGFRIYSPTKAEMREHLGKLINNDWTEEQVQSFLGSDFTSAVELARPAKND